MQRIRLAVSRLDEEGRGVGTHDGREVHVAGVLPGEVAQVDLEHASPHSKVSWAKLAVLDGPLSPSRVSPSCFAYGRCGGCVLQHLEAAGQLAAKAARVATALAAAGVAWPEVAVVPSPSTTRYRNRAKFVLSPGANGQVRLCSFAPGSHALVDMTGCQVIEPALSQVAAQLAPWLDGSGLRCHDEKTRTGELRYLLLRADRTGRVLALIVTHSAAGRAPLAERAAALMAAQPALVGVAWQANPSTGGRVLGEDRAETLAGVATLDDEVGPVRLRLSPEAFFQVNRAQAERLYAEVADAVDAAPGRKLVDLYCGVGGFALTCATRGAEVVGVELSEAAVADARAAAEAQALPVRFACADAAAGLPAAAALLGAGPLDGVIVDPPRKGLGAATRAAVLAASPHRLALIFCEPAALSRDLPPLVAAGYRVVDVRAYDLMPGTPEVETLVVLTRD